MKRKPLIKRVQKTPETQRERFIDTARAAECDESEAAFEGKLRRIAVQKTKTPVKKKGRS